MSIDDSTATATTDVDGRYTLSGVPLGLHALKLRRDGCEGVMAARVTREGASTVENGYDFSFDLGPFEVPCATQVGDAKVLEFELNSPGTSAVFTGEGYDGDHPIHRWLLDVVSGEKHELTADSIYLTAHFTPDGGRVYWLVQYADARPRRLFSSPVAAFAPAEHATNGPSEYQPQFSADGTRALVFDTLVEGTQAGRAVVIDFAANTVTVVSPAAYFNGPVSAIDPTGRFVALFDAFDRNAGDSTSLRIVDVSTGTSRVVDTGIHTPYAPAFRRNGGLLAWYRTPTTGTQQFRITETSANGQAHTLLSDDGLPRGISGPSSPPPTAAACSSPTAAGIRSCRPRAPRPGPASAATSWARATTARTSSSRRAPAATRMRSGSSISRGIPPSSCAHAGRFRRNS